MVCNCNIQSMNGFDKLYPWAIFIHNKLIEHEKVERFIIIFNLPSENVYAIVLLLANRRCKFQLVSIEYKPKSKKKTHRMRCKKKKQSDLAVNYWLKLNYYQINRWFLLEGIVEFVLPSNVYLNLQWMNEFLPNLDYV